MTFRRLLPLLLLAALLVAPASALAKSRYRVGIGEQSATMFLDKDWKALKLKRVRYVLPWDWEAHDYQVAETTAYMTAARAAKQEVLVHFTAARGCYVEGVYLKTPECRAPSVSAYTRSFKAFRKAFPSVKVFGAWNEANHKSQPTYRSPKRAAQYFNAMRKACRSCKIVAADLLDSSNLLRYTRSFMRSAKGEKVFGLHNYSDVNRKRTKVTVPFLKLVKGEVWLTETGGIVKFEHFKRSTSRAASRIAYMFKLADRFSRKLRGYRGRITRVYTYEWAPDTATDRFDAGLVDQNGKPRKGYRTFKAKVKSKSK